MNAFSQNEFNGAYDAAVYFQDRATGLKQLRLLADHGNSEAREFLGVIDSKGKDETLGLSDDQASVVSTPTPVQPVRQTCSVVLGLYRKFLRGVECGWPTTQRYLNCFILDQIFYLPVWFDLKTSRLSFAA